MRRAGLTSDVELTVMYTIDSETDRQRNTERSERKIKYVESKSKEAVSVRCNEMYTQNENCTIKRNSAKGNVNLFRNIDFPI